MKGRIKIEDTQGRYTGSGLGDKISTRDKSSAQRDAAYR